MRTLTRSARKAEPGDTSADGEHQEGESRGTPAVVCAQPGRAALPAHRAPALPQRQGVGQPQGLPQVHILL